MKKAMQARVHRSLRLAALAALAASAVCAALASLAARATAASIAASALLLADIRRSHDWLGGLLLRLLAFR